MNPRGGRDPANQAEELRAAANQVNSAIVALTAAHPTLGKPLLLGFSQGGMISFAMAVLHGASIDRALPLSGALPPPLWPRAGSTEPIAPLTALHGTKDAVVPLAPTKQLVATLTERGFAAKLLPFEGIGHSLSPKMRSTLFGLLDEYVGELRAACLAGPAPEHCGQ